MPATFSFIHLSDFHISVESDRFSAPGLMRRDVRQSIDTAGPIKFANIQRRQIGIASLAKPASHASHIVSSVAQFCLRFSRTVNGMILTGDLATTGLPDDLMAARGFITDPANDGFVTSRGLPTLSAAQRQIYLMPGNHDRYANNFATPNSISFDFKFPDFLAHQKHKDFVGHWVLRKREHTIGFVYADFTLRNQSDASSRYHAYGQGRVYDDVLSDLVARTFWLRKEHPGIVLNWALHFAPFECGMSLRLNEYDRIIAAAKAANVLSTLCGHLHVTRSFSDAGHSVYCAGSAGCAESQSTTAVHILRYEVSDNPSVVRQNYFWNREARRFERGADD